MRTSFGNKENFVIVYPTLNKSNFIYKIKQHNIEYNRGNTVLPHYKSVGHFWTFFSQS